MTTTILLNNKKVTRDSQFWAEFNWDAFKKGEAVFTEDTDSTKDLAVMFVSYENDTVRLERRTKFWQNYVCNRSLDLA